MLEARPEKRRFCCWMPSVVRSRRMAAATSRETSSSVSCARCTFAMACFSSGSPTRMSRTSWSYAGIRSRVGNADRMRSSVSPREDAMCFICVSSVLRMRWYLSGSGTSSLLALRNALSSISCAVRMVGTFSSMGFPTNRCYITLWGPCRALETAVSLRSDVDDGLDFGDPFLQDTLDPGLEGQGGHAAALAGALHAQL